MKINTVTVIKGSETGGSLFPLPAALGFDIFKLSIFLTDITDL